VLDMWTQLGLENSDLIEIKLAIEPNAKSNGGMTLFGLGFGKHDEDIIVKLFYS